MNRPSPPSRERRRYGRLVAQNVRVRCASGELDDPSSDVNFARRLVNVSLGGMCIETVGRLRPGVQLNAELRFDSFGGGLRTKAQLIWAQTVKNGAQEVHLAGFRFIGPEFTAPVRDFLEGDRATLIVNMRRAEFNALKRDSEARKASLGPKKWSAPKKTAALSLVLLFLYVGSFGGFVVSGRRDSEAPGIRFRYLGGESEGSAVGKALATLYHPIYWAFRKAGVDLTCESP